MESIIFLLQVPVCGMKCSDLRNEAIKILGVQSENKVPKKICNIISKN